MRDITTQWVTFIQNALPPLQAGTYVLSAQQTTGQPGPDNFSASRTIAVVGSRFSLSGGEVNSVFPPDLANGEYEYVLPSVQLNTRTLPWQRAPGTHDANAPWLAVLVMESSQAPELAKRTVKELVALNSTITAPGNPQTWTGSLPVGTLCYPGLTQLDYGETGDDTVSTVDLDIRLFNQIAPSAADLAYLAHIRQTDTANGPDSAKDEESYAVVFANRLSQPNKTSLAYLVSVEGMGPYLPDNNGSASPQLPTGTTHIRLTVFRQWSFFANDMDETFQGLLENLNKINGIQGVTTLQLANALSPTSAQIDAAMTAQAAGTTTALNADVLVANAFAMGYTALNHILSQSGNTVSWYRGPLLPYPVPECITVPVAAADSLLCYNPQTGMFDTSYAAAWSLGQLLALQSNSFSTTLFNWKKNLQKNQAALEEQSLLESDWQQSELFLALRSQRHRLLADILPPIPQEVVDFISALRLLVGVPLSYLIPDENMQQPETLHMFTLDYNWIEALVDGAFSIGRATESDLARDHQQSAQLRGRCVARSRTLRTNHPPALALTGEASSTPGPVTGFVLRSQVVTGWPNLRVIGYSDLSSDNQLRKLRQVQLNRDMILCLFDGQVQRIAIHEAPEQLHMGAEGSPGGFTAALRAVNGDQAGEQYQTDPKGGPATVPIATRADQYTVKVADTANAIKTKLNSDFNQNIVNFTSAELGLELIKGVVEVEYKQAGGQA